MFTLHFVQVLYTNDLQVWVTMFCINLYLQYFNEDLKHGSYLNSGGRA